MKKKLLLLGILVLSIGLVWKFSTKESDTEKLRKKHAEYLKNHPYNKSLALTKKERKANGVPPNKYFEEQYLLEINPNTGRTHPENYIELQDKLSKERLAQRVPGDASDNPWVERGPNNVGGRTRVVLFDPNDSNNKRVFAAGVSGGLWVNSDITDANVAWTRVGIPENLSVSCITVDPNNSQIMYLGTGESYTGDDAVGNGVWKSTDGGTTWSNVFSDSFNVTLSERLFYINDIKAWNNPTTSKTEVFFGVGGAYYGEGAQWVGHNKTGLYKSTDDGSNWSKITINTPEGSPYEPNDIEISSDNSIWIGSERNAWGHGGGTILKSTDGSSFTVKHTITNGRRTQIAVSGQNANTLYVLAQVRTVSGSSVVAPFLSMLKTTDGFTSTTGLGLPIDSDSGIPANDFTRGQAFYDLVIEVDPTDDTKVYTGGIDLFRSTNSGSTWSHISKWSNNNALAFENVSLVHADQHAWAFHPTDPNKAVIGNDGGVFYASSLSAALTSTTAIEARNKEFNVTQFYNGAIGQDENNELLLAGAQDNGTPFINGASSGINASVDVFGGDGAYSFIDKDGEYMIVSYVYNVKARLNLPYNGTGVTIDNDQDSGSFINPQELDDNLDILYSNSSGGGKDSIARYTSIKTSLPVRKSFTTGNLAGGATAMKISPYTTTSSKLFVGTAFGKILKVENANTTPIWTDITSNMSASGSVSAIEFGKNESEILVTFHNYGVISIWYSDNGGTTWQNKEGDFPDIPIKDILMNPLNNDQVIIGTQLGVWTTGNFKDASPKWTQANNGMSNVKVTSLELRSSDNTVLASTYGRGMFTGKFTAAAASVDDVLTDKNVFTVYPTINNGEFTVFAKNTLGIAKLSIFDIRGRKVFNQDIDFTSNENQKISTANLKGGIYIVNLVGENNIKSSRKIIVE